MVEYPFQNKATNKYKEAFIYGWALFSCLEGGVVA